MRDEDSTLVFRKKGTPSDPPTRTAAQALVLASASPRRAELLTALRVAFRVVPSKVEEVRKTQELPSAYARRLAREKALDVSRTLGVEARYVLGADTIVVLDEDVLEKPKDDLEARGMLARLQGRWHEVITAIALIGPGAQLRGERAVTTRVRFRPLDAGAIARYVATGEGRDKAGAYAVQGLGAGLVQELAGSYGAVVGLPAVETLELLVEHGALELWP